MRKLTLKPQHRELFARIPKEDMYEFVNKLMDFINGEDDIRFDDPVLDAIFTVFAIETVDKRKYTSAINGKKGSRPKRS